MSKMDTERTLPVIRKYHYNFDTKEEILNKDSDNKLITRYPTVYIVIDKITNTKYKAYVGETNNIVRRTEEHLKSESPKRKDWAALNSSKNAELIVIGHKEFNKSLTLDIENQLMEYLLTDDNIGKLNNRRANDQDLYFTHDKFKQIFSDIWNELSKSNEILFPNETSVKNSAIFKASPFHKLTNEQILAKDKIADRINKIKNNPDMDKLIIVRGSAGTGKTVLLDSLFADLNDKQQEAYMLVNNDEQAKIYQNIASKLGIKSTFGDLIANKPTKFLNRHLIRNKDTKEVEEKYPIDIALIDEAHLLLTEGHMNYRGKGHLQDIMSVSNVVVAVLDPYQVLHGTEYMEKEYYDYLMKRAAENGNLIELSEQNRMQASKKTINWMREIITNGRINKIPEDDNYDLRVFDNVNDMYDEIKKHDDSVENLTKGLSRIVATYDWKFIKGSKNMRTIHNIDGTTSKDYWRVNVGKDFNLPWNGQIPVEKRFKKLSWAEQPQSINEVGSVFTIQGFDLNYCGLIIGPSVKYRDGKIVYDKNYNYDKNVIETRKMSNGERKDVSSELIRNQLNILMTRGVHGLYIYAVDEELRKELLKQSK